LNHVTLSLASSPLGVFSVGSIIPPMEYPRLNARRENADPMKPVAPVTRIFMSKTKIAQVAGQMSS
jgi:hypothetical protein